MFSDTLPGLTWISKMTHLWLCNVFSSLDSPVQWFRNACTIHCLQHTQTLTEVYGKNALAPHEQVCMQTSWVHRIFFFHFHCHPGVNNHHFLTKEGALSLPLEILVQPLSVLILVCSLPGRPLCISLCIWRKNVHFKQYGIVSYRPHSTTNRPSVHQSADNRTLSRLNLLIHDLDF